MEKMKQVGDLKINSRICLYGAGDYGRDFFQLIRRKRPDIQVIRFIDTYKTGELYGIEIIKPDGIKAIESQFDFILIASGAHRNDIIKSLNQIGIDNYYSVSFNTLDVRLSFNEGTINKNEVVPLHSQMNSQVSMADEVVNKTQKMKILLVSSPFGQKLGHYYTFPLGLAYISSVLKSAGHYVRCLNLNHREWPSESLAEALQTFKPDVVGTGGLSPHYPMLRDILATSKALRPTAITIIGGGAVSSEPELVLESTLADIGVIGEGEITSVELLNALATGRDLSEVDGLIYKDSNGNLRKTKPRTAIKNLDSIPYPDYDGFEIEVLLDSLKSSDSYHLNFSDNPRVLDIISSRSCPYPCTFCFHPLGKTYRQRSLDNFFAELDYVIKKYRITQLSIMDELFAANHEKLKDFCYRIKSYNIEWVIQLHVSIVNETVLHLMRDAGCRSISYGIESMNDLVLSSMKKNTSRSMTHKSLQMTYDAAICIQGNLIFGDPAETFETACDSLTWWSNNRHFQV
ncbi:MAG: cobalamin-dependent protein, partial [Desulfamplus sp.]|nr:cobalamin-dependent protein [Desulfamplus sp.]